MPVWESPTPGIWLLVSVWSALLLVRIWTSTFCSAVQTANIQDTIRDSWSDWLRIRMPGAVMLVAMVGGAIWVFWLTPWTWLSKEIAAAFWPRFISRFQINCILWRLHACGETSRVSEVAAEIVFSFAESCRFTERQLLVAACFFSRHLFVCFGVSCLWHLWQIPS